MKRIMIIGQPGSGKSTLARRLGLLASLPIFHMDHIHWLPGWLLRDEGERHQMTLDVIAQPEWVFEGGFSATYQQRLDRADTVIWLDIPWHRRVWNVTRRLIANYGRSRVDMQDGCEEKIGWHSLEFYQFIWRTRHSNRVRLARLIASVPSGKTVIVLRSFAQVDQFFDRIEVTKKAGD